MAGGYGLYSGVNVKDGDGVIRVREVLNTTLTLSATTQQTTPVIVPNLGDIVAFEYEITASVDSALTNPQPIDHAIKEISIQDVRNEPIWDGVAGTDLKYIEFVKGLKGKFQNPPTVSTSAQTVKFLIPHHIDKKDQNVKIGFTVAPYSDLSGDATTGSCSIKVRVFYRDGATESTARLKKLTKSVAAGINNLQPVLPMGANVNELVILGNDSLLDVIRFSRDGAEEIEVDKNAIEAYVNSMTQDGYQSGCMVLPITPFVVHDKVKFDYKATGADTLNLYLFITQ